MVNFQNLIRASYVTYTGFILSRHGKAALSGFMVLLEHLCYNLDGLVSKVNLLILELGLPITLNY